jgi:predicted TPR repeat methyltransferase
MNRKQRRAAAKLGGGSSTRTATTVVSDAGGLLAAGLEHHRAGRLDKAVACYQQLLAVQPNHADALHLRGIVAHQVAQYDLAVELIRQALKQSPGNPAYFCNLGNALKAQGKLADAMVSYERALALKPDFAEAHYNLGNALQEQSKLHAAVVSYERALVFKPDYAEAHNNLGNALKDQGKLDEAIVSYERALALNPFSAEAHNNLGKALKDQGKLDEAVACYRQAIVLKPDYAEAHLNLGTALQELGRVADAEASYRRALEVDPPDTLGAQLLLARLGLERMPTRASEAHLHKLYAKRSHIWDAGKTYFAHELVAEALKKLPHKSGKLDILDAGCGTGLVGVLVRDLANRLDGVDQSPAMLEKAKEKDIYDDIHLADLLTFMLNNLNCYDVITSAATLIHFGDLTAVFNAAAASLRDDGFFVFTLFANDSGHNNQEVVVSHAQGGVYAHSVRYVRRLAEASGFFVVILESRIHEHDKNNVPIMGLVVALRRRPRLAA